MLHNVVHILKLLKKKIAISFPAEHLNIFIMLLDCADKCKCKKISFNGLLRMNIVHVLLETTVIFVYVIFRIIDNFGYFKG